MTNYEKINAELFRRAEMSAATSECLLLEAMKSICKAYAKAVAVRVYEDASRYAVNFYRDVEQGEESND